MTLREGEMQAAAVVGTILLVALPLAPHIVVLGVAVAAGVGVIVALCLSFVRLLSEHPLGAAVALVLTVMLSLGLVSSVVLFTKKAEAHKPVIEDMDAIEATVAYSKKPQKQPQKKTRAPEPPDKQHGVSHDEKAKPVEPKKEDPPKKKEPTDPFAAAGHHDPSDDPVGKPTEDPGVFNGNERGWASETKGHPYLQKLAQDIHNNFTLPTISDSNGSPVGCFHLGADGKIVDTKFEDQSGSADLDRAAQDAIDAVKKLRNQDPSPVPTELLGTINRWICFRFNPNAAH